MLKQERYFYVVFIAIFASAIALRISIFGLEGLLTHQTISFGKSIDGFFVELASDYHSLIHIVNPYIIILAVAVVAQVTATSICAYIYFLYPDLRSNDTRQNLQGKALVEWYTSRGISPFVPMVLPIIRISVFVAVMMLFIRPLAQAITMAPSVLETLGIMSLYFAAIIPYVLTSETIFWRDSTVIIHILIGMLCVLFMPFTYLIYFTVVALCQTVKVLVNLLSEAHYETNSTKT